jgi:hypothetical protein
MLVIKLNSTIGIYFQAILEKSGTGGLQHVNPTHLRMEPSYTTTSTERAEVWIVAAFILGPQVLRF